MCEDRDCDCHKKHHHQFKGHYGHHRHGYSSIVKRVESQVTVPGDLLDVADVEVGDFLEIRIRKVRKHKKHHKE